VWPGSGCERESRETTFAGEDRGECRGFKRLASACPFRRENVDLAFCEGVKGERWPHLSARGTASEPHRLSWRLTRPQDAVRAAAVRPLRTATRRTGSAGNGSFSDCRRGFLATEAMLFANNLARPGSQSGEPRPLTTPVLPRTPVNGVLGDPPLAGDHTCNGQPPRPGGPAGEPRTAPP
jgi:hypothetical protein